jgi:ribonuclease P protein component
MKLSRLRGRKVCDRVMRNGKVWKGKTMMIRWLPGAPRTLPPGTQGFFIGTFASTKLHKSAVKRNRMRRRCREALRTIVSESDKLPTVQLLLSPRSPSLTCDFHDISSDVHAFLSTIDSCPPPK